MGFSLFAWNKIKSSQEKAHINMKQVRYLKYQHTPLACKEFDAYELFAFFLSAAFFFYKKLTFSKHFLCNTIRMANSLEPDLQKHGKLPSLKRAKMLCVIFVFVQLSEYPTPQENHTQKRLLEKITILLHLTSSKWTLKW